MKNVIFIAGPKNGGAVSARLSTLHHSAESRVGIVEAMVACFLVIAVVGFALVVVR